MHFGLRHPIARTLFALLPLLLAGSAAAGPVANDDGAGPGTGIEAPHTASPNLSAPTMGDALAPAGSLKTVPSGGAEATPSSSALAAEIIKESDAGAAANDPLRPAQRPGAQAARAPAAGNPSARSGTRTAEPEFDGGLREMGKAALHWLKETVPWLRKDADESSDRRSAAADAADWSESPLEAGEAGRGGRAGASPPTAGVALAQAGPGTSVGYGSSARTTPDTAPNIVREFIDLVRMVLEHPMTWLVVALFVIGGIVMSKVDRRPK